MCSNGLLVRSTTAAQTPHVALMRKAPDQPYRKYDDICGTHVNCQISSSFPTWTRWMSPRITQLIKYISFRCPHGLLVRSTTATTALTPHVALTRKTPDQPYCKYDDTCGTHVDYQISSSFPTWTRWMSPRITQLIKDISFTCGAG
ncbi:hypothetical protein AMTR_s00133p00065590 [Amborella trichopoda]|uniref:Uncharacterized protein n=1 Tax=Amborella trichopoda TaxID=13333 RepID=W1P919_AMBTC|nr:hypothetical protein AMTR_s00133p00065590 [Amborella trichopoda]